MEEVVNLIKNAIKLKEVERKGWKRTGIARVESVADHTFMLAFLSMIIGDKRGMDTEKMIKMALLHDLAEVVTGDITPGEMEREEKLRRENEVMNELLKNFKGYSKIWKEFFEGKSKEAKMVRELDLMEMVLQACVYSQKYRDKDLREFKEEGNKIKDAVLSHLLHQYFREAMR